MSNFADQPFGKMPIKKIDKQEILQRCWEVLSREGYHGASISLLASATGLGKAGLLHHFGSKEQLMQEVLQYAGDWWRNAVLGVAQEDLPTVQRIEKLLRRHNRLVKNERRGCFFANTVLETGRDGPFNAFIKTIFDQWQQVLGNLYAEVMPAAEADRLAYRLMLEHEGAILLYKLTDDTAHLDDFVRRAVDIFTFHQQKSNVSISL